MIKPDDYTTEPAELEAQRIMDAYGDGKYIPGIVGWAVNRQTQSYENMLESRGFKGDVLDGAMADAVPGIQQSALEDLRQCGIEIPNDDREYQGILAAMREREAPKAGEVALVENVVR